MSPSLHRLIALALLISLIGAGYYAFDRYWLGHFQRYSDESTQLLDRLVRFKRLAASREPLANAIKKVREASPDNAYYLSQASPNLAATDLQQQVRSAIESNGGSLTSTQILPVSQQGNFSRVAIRVQMTGDVPVLQKMLYALETAQPLLFIENVQIRGRTIRQRVRTPQNQPRDRRTRRNQPRTPPQIKTTVQLTTQFELVGYMRS